MQRNDPPTQASLKAEELLTVTDVAAFLGVPIQTLYSWRYKGCGPRALKIGRHLRYRRRDVERWLDGQYPQAS